MNKSKKGHPLDKSTMVGAQVSQAQLDRILGYIDLGREEGATCLTGGERNRMGQELDEGFLLSPPCYWQEHHARVSGGNFWSCSGRHHL
ncbi:aldehyde dehydrogenase family protein [Paenalcaligenes hominis]|uniref:aldehyde dehydrogenase family protein n=1 Tax=Paenalcaligenes hominis TaxID=643674 RepID=UPI0036218C11